MMYLGYESCTLDQVPEYGLPFRALSIVAVGESPGCISAQVLCLSMRPEFIVTTWHVTVGKSFNCLTCSSLS